MSKNNAGVGFIGDKENKCVIIDGENIKRCFSLDGSYNYRFDKRTGEFIRWGKTYDDNPVFSPAGPEILDLEIASGYCSGSCKFCYKNNSISQEIQNMSFETFKQVFDRFPNSLTQIAFGICDINTNPDFFRMMEYSREHGVIPNFTLSGIGFTEEHADKVASLCGAAAVSVYETDKNRGYDTIKMLTDCGMTQINIHAMISEETIDFVKEICEDIVKDPRLAAMNAIVFLGVKPKGRARGNFTPLSLNNFGKLIDFCTNNNICYGFDSCSAPRFETYVRNSEALSEEEKKKFLELSESCESLRMSAYCNWKGEFFPCSFTEGEPGWEEGINVLSYDNFLQVWYHPKAKKWRESLIKNMCNECAKCITFPEINI